MAHNALGSDSRHELIGLMDTLATLKPQGEGNDVDEIARLGGSQRVVGVWHAQMLGRTREQSKNIRERDERQNYGRPRRLWARAVEASP